MEKIEMLNKFIPIKTDDRADIDIALIVKYLQESTNPEEAFRVENWINENETNRSEVSRIAELFFMIRTYDRMTLRDVDSAYQKVQEQIHKKLIRKRIIFSKRSLLTVAASLIGAFLLSSAYNYFKEQKIIPEKVNYITAASNLGVRTRINLSDGTIVFLNSGSKVTYPDHFTDNHRNVKLEGEAFFQVKADPDKPFVVHTNNDRAIIQVTGTTFNVQSFRNDNEFTTTLVEGMVNIILKRKNGTAMQMKLTPSEKIIFDESTDSAKIVKADTEIETAWTKDRLIFRNLPMPQVLKMLAYNYNAEIKIMNPAIYSYRFTGTFQSRQLAQILEYMKISSNINYTLNFPRSDDSLSIKKTRVILN